MDFKFNASMKTMSVSRSKTAGLLLRGEITLIDYISKFRILSIRKNFILY